MKTSGLFAMIKAGLATLALAALVAAGYLAGLNDCPLPDQAEVARMRHEMASLRDANSQLKLVLKRTEGSKDELRGQLREDERAAWERAKKNASSFRAWKNYNKRCPGGENGTELCWTGDLPGYEGDPTGSLRFLRRGPIPGVSELERLRLLKEYAQP